MDFKGRDIDLAVSLLARHGIALTLPDSLLEDIRGEKLFYGDDLLFKEIVCGVNTYFEYGIGRSTLWVARNSEAVIHAVDTDRDWIRRTEANLAPGSKHRLNVKHIDVGSVGDWGFPLGFSRRANFKLYREILWRHGGADVVLIDGRFRVACFLTCLKFAARGAKLIFDDYTNRPEYHLVEEYVYPIEKCGRQALFEVGTGYDSDQLDTEIDRFGYVWG